MRRLRLPRFEVGSLGSGPKIPICGYQFLETECPIQSTRIGQVPDFSTTEPHELLSPFDASLSKNSCKGRFTQKRQTPRAITSKLSFEFPGSFVKFMTRKLAGSYSRSLHCSRQTVSVLKNRAVVFRSNQMWSKPRQEKNRPESVSWAREMVPRPGSAQPRINPTKHHIKVLAE
jgi:hypothetical protein